MIHQTVRLVAAVAFLFTTAVQAKTLVVSDIDDTLKIAHVGSKADATKRAFRTDLHFSGMTELFQLLDSKGDVDFAYVSNAPSKLMGSSHRKFLKEWKFPEGGLYLNESFFGGNHKEATITKILEAAKADVVIFLGDNSEIDAAVYASLVKKFPAVRTYQFIRMPYSNSKDATFDPILPGQIPFITPMELVLALSAGGEISVADADAFSADLQTAVVAADDVDMGPGFFPNWMDCRDFKWQPISFNPALTEYNKKITQRCDL